jgi:hypothetical protein
MLAFLVVLMLGAMLGGFGMGMPELVLLGLLAGAAFVIASREAPSAECTLLPRTVVPMCGRPDPT